jgi:hypothetical protein
VARRPILTTFKQRIGGATKKKEQIESQSNQRIVFGDLCKRPTLCCQVKDVYSVK